MTTKLDLTENQLSNRSFYLILACLTLIAAGLRFYQLGHWSLWIDEISYLQTARHMFSRISLGAVAYYFLNGFSLSLQLVGISVYFLGDGEWAARITPAITGILTIPLAGIALRAWLDDKVALLTSLLLTLSTWHIYWSQNSRYLVMQLLIYTLLFVLIYHCWHHRRYYYLILIVPLFILLYLERLTGFGFVLITLMCYVLMLSSFRYREQWRSILTVRNGIVVIVTIIIFGLVFIWRIWSNPSTWLILFEKRDTHTMFSLFMSYVMSIRPLIFLLGIVGLGYVLKTYERNHVWYLFSLVAIVPIILVMIASFALFTNARYMFPALIFWLALAALAVLQMIDSRQRLVRLFGVLFLLLLLVDSTNQLWRYHVYQEQIFRPDWKGAYAYVESQMSPNDVIVTSEWRRPLAEYYLTDGITIIEDRELTDTVSSISEKSLSGSNGDTIWFVLLEARIGPDLQPWLASHQSQLVYDTIEVQVFRYTPE